MFQLCSFRFSRASQVWRIRLPRGVFRGTTFRDIEAEGVRDIYLSSDKRCDMLYLVSVIHTFD